MQPFVLAMMYVGLAICDFERHHLMGILLFRMAQFQRTPERDDLFTALRERDGVIDLHLVARITRERSRQLQIECAQLIQASQEIAGRVFGHRDYLARI